MANAALLRLWNEVRRDFSEAQSILPSRPVEIDGNLDRLKEWLDHNELELALDELEMLGEDNASPREFWQSLLRAAERMGLKKHHERLSRRA